MSTRSRSRSRSRDRSRRSNADRSRSQGDGRRGRSRSRSRSPHTRRRRRPSEDGPPSSNIGPSGARDPSLQQGGRGGGRRDGDAERGITKKKARDLSHLMSSGQGHGGPIQWGKVEDEQPTEEPPQEVEKPNFGLSGALAKDSVTGNTYNGVVLKWSEPPDARQPTKRWRLYVFRAGELLDTLHIHRQSAFLVGREKKVADILVEHPSCSKQHAVIQFRIKETLAADGIKKLREVRPYVMDLESTNGTFLNGQRIEHSRYIELLEKDMLRFGDSTREYILLSPE